MCNQKYDITFSSTWVRSVVALEDSSACRGSHSIREAIHQVCPLDQEKRQDTDCSPKLDALLGQGSSQRLSILDSEAEKKQKR